MSHAGENTVLFLLLKYSGNTIIGTRTLLCLSDDGRVRSLLLTPSGRAVQFKIALPMAAFTQCALDPYDRYLIKAMSER